MTKSRNNSHCSYRPANQVRFTDKNLILPQPGPHLCLCIRHPKPVPSPEVHPVTLNRTLQPYFQHLGRMCRKQISLDSGESLTCETLRKKGIPCDVVLFRGDIGGRFIFFIGMVKKFYSTSK